MKFEDIFRKLLAEQQDDDDIELNLPDDQEAGADEPEQPEQPEEPGIPGGPERPQPPQRSHPEIPKKLSRTQIIKAKWKEEAPEITDQQMNDAVAFFNERKDRLKPYKPYGTIDSRTNRFYVNLPEITSLVERFPQMETILSDEIKMKDMGNYTWDQISFYQNRIYHQAIEQDDENWVKGDLTEDQRIKLALERWKKPHNQIINDETLVAYKVECQSEAVALGALDHAIYRKYNTTKGINSLPPDIKANLPRLINYSWGSQPWCVARPIGGQYGSNLWTNYRPERGFYFILDNSRPEWDQYHVVALQPRDDGRISITTMPNNGDKFFDWSEIENIYPPLRGKQRLFPYFGTTSRERSELTLDDIKFKRGDPNDFAIQPEAVHRVYIENNRFIRDKRCFLTLSFENRKLYVDKTSRNNNDYKERFICQNPADDPLAILDILKHETKPEDLYKYLDNFVLKTRENIPEGILAIKKGIIGNNWRRFLTDIETTYTLCTSKDAKTRFNRTPKYGIIDLNTFDWIKDIRYVEGKPQSFVRVTQDANGIKQKTIYIASRYSISFGNQIDPNDYFYFLYTKDALINRNSDLYMKGKFFEGPEGDAFLREKVANGTFIKI